MSNTDLKPRWDQSRGRHERPSDEFLNGFSYEIRALIDASFDVIDYHERCKKGLAGQHDEVTVPRRLWEALHRLMSPPVPRPRRR